MKWVNELIHESDTHHRYMALSCTTAPSTSHTDRRRTSARQPLSFCSSPLRWCFADRRSTEYPFHVTHDPVWRSTHFYHRQPLAAHALFWVWHTLFRSPQPCFPAKICVREVRSVHLETTFPWEHLETTFPSGHLETTYWWEHLYNIHSWEDSETSNRSEHLETSNSSQYLEISTYESIQNFRSHQSIYTPYTHHSI